LGILELEEKTKQKEKVLKPGDQSRDEPGPEDLPPTEIFPMEAISTSEWASGQKSACWACDRWVSK